MKKITPHHLLLIFIIVISIFLRVWQLDKVPVSLFGDELDIGYHAYSLLKTGKDYSGNFLPIHLQSLADYKSPLYTYTIVPTVALFGISAWGVRLMAAVFGVVSIIFVYLLTRFITANKTIGLIAAAILSITPWHLQYSRIGYEMLAMLAFYLAGLYFFIKGVGRRRDVLLILAAVLLGITPWVYHSAKVFLPLTILTLLIVWHKQIRTVKPAILVAAVLILSVLISPVVYDSLFGQGINRLKGTSIFNDPTTTGEIGFARLRDAKMRDIDSLPGVKASLPDRLFHNQVTVWAGKIGENYFRALSPEFLFLKGDPNPRHTVEGFGEFYWIQAALLVLGIGFLLLKPVDQKFKILLVAWTLLSPLPAVITKDGGTHASRLIYLLPPLIIFMSMGFYYSLEALKGLKKSLFILIIVGSLLLSFISYQHTYWVHYPWDFEKWWNYGYEEAVKEAGKQKNSYENIVISNADEPSLIYFLGWSQYSPEAFRKEVPFASSEIPGLGKMEKLDNFYFPPIGQGYDLYTLATILPSHTLYIAPFSEIKFDLSEEPERVPKELKVVKIVYNPSGKPSFYMFAKNGD